MNLHQAVMLVGLFGVPVVLLAHGHRLRRRSDRSRRVFWGAATGHVLAAVIATVASMITPEAWTGAESMRGAAGYWSLLLLPLFGGVIGALRAPPR